MATTKSRLRSFPSLRWSMIPRTNLIEGASIALSSLRANLLRTVLTMLGIIIGVSSVVALLAVGNGATASITERISSIGSNLLTVLPGQARGAGQARTQAQSLTMADAEAIAELPGVGAVAPIFQGNGQIVSETNNSQSQVVGVTAPFFQVRNLSAQNGSVINTDQTRDLRSVAVLGNVVANNLFGSRDPVGQTIRINGTIFEVVGVLTAKGSAPGGSVDEQVFVPIGVAQLKLFGARVAGSSSLRVSNISIQVASADQIPTVSALVSATMRDRHHLNRDGSEDDFNIFNQADILDTLNQTTSILTTFLGAIAGISLVVGGIGVMNIMLVSVTERTKEIGLRKAVGARRSDILQQFLIEALIVSSIGGLIGILLGVGIAKLVGLSGVLTPVISLSSIMLALSCSLAVGLFFGIYPAQRAARLRPIEALRYD